MFAVNSVLRSPGAAESLARFTGAARHRSIRNPSSASQVAQLSSVAGQLPPKVAATSVFSIPCALFATLRKERGKLSRLFSASCELFTLSLYALVQGFKCQLLCFQVRAHSLPKAPGI